MPNSKIRSYSIHLLLFLLTCITTTLAGAEWQYGRGFIGSADALGWQEFWQGLYFSVPFLSILTAHEFGHYITARIYQVKVTLPYYIPLWLGQGFFGTIGAFIRIKSPLKTLQEYFDIGIAGPLAGFVIAIGVIWYGFTHLPPQEHIFTIHEEYKEYGVDYANQVYSYDFFRKQDSLYFYAYYQQQIAEGNETKIPTFKPSSEYSIFALGDNLLFSFFRNYVADDPSLVPNAFEMAHYPFLLAGYLALLFTSLNLIPIGQLDGGHILFSMVGYHRHKIIARVLFIAFVFYAGLGLVKPIEYDNWFGSNLDLSVRILIYIGYLYLAFSRTVNGFLNILLVSLAVFAGQFLLSTFFPTLEGYHGWLLFALIIGRLLGVYHPPVLYERPLSTGRIVLGWLSLLIFILSFSPNPLKIVTITG